MFYKIFASRDRNIRQSMATCPYKVVTDYRTLHITLFTSVSTTLVYLVYLILPRFNYILVSPFILFLRLLYIYIYHLISIDLQLSCLFNSYTLQSLQKFY